MAGTLREIDYRVLQQCMHCGMCLPACPTYEMTRRERNGPRGRIALMRAVVDGELPADEHFAAEIGSCLGCLACQSACPAGVDYARLFEAARAQVEASPVRKSTARTFWRWITLEQLFMHPRLLRATGRALGIYQRSGLERLARKWRLTRWLPASLRRLEPQAPRIAAKFSADLIAPHEAPAGGPRFRVALLTGCVQDLAFPEINRDTADVLLANGCAVDTPASQGCCGSLHAHNGEPHLAADLARRMIDLIPPHRYDAIITNAGGCGSHLRHYGRLLAGDPAYAAAAQLWDAKVRDVHEWLREIGCRSPRDPAGGAAPTVITYHDSCHLLHGQKVAAAPRALLRLLPGAVLIELPESGWCCGSAGVHTITRPEDSQRLLERKIGHIRRTAATILATANPGCHLQIARGLEQAGAPVEVLHPVTLLARAYRAEPPDFPT
jgi:glycolate oxidase iron-sulfur subunit